jgi:hypothetical protein
MEKIKNFKKVVKSHKRELSLAGYSLSTINSWIYTDRMPTFDTAVAISSILGMKISEIPYFKTERG